jgi:nucleoside-triphosphatase
VDLGGQRGVLSRVELKGPDRVRKYGVDIGGFEAYLASLERRITEANAVIVDEICKMECLSTKLRSLILQVLDSPRLLAATVALKGAPFIETIKQRDDVKLFYLRPESRDTLGRTILDCLGDL